MTEQSLQKDKPLSCSSVPDSENGDQTEILVLPDVNDYRESNSRRVAKTLEGRLLCASKVAYIDANFFTKNTSTTSTKEIRSELEYFKSVGYVQGSTAKRISRSINSAFIGKNKDGIIVAFRGTVSSSALDWIQNAGLLLRKASISLNHDGKTQSLVTLPGRIHSGFFAALRSILSPLKKEILNMLSYPEEKIYFTGHSKGGALASIAAMIFQLDESLPNVTAVYTYASAKPGDSEFRNSYNKMINQISFESYLDIIPFLPPSTPTMLEEMKKNNPEMSGMVEEMLWDKANLKKQHSNKKKKSTKSSLFQWDYQTVGERRYIDRDANIKLNVNRDLDNLRIQEFESETILRLNKFSSAHCVGCPCNSCDGFFFRALASEVCNSGSSCK